MLVGENPRPGRHSTSPNDDQINRLRAVLLGNRHLNVREVADELGISIGYCHLIFTGKSSASRQCKIRATFFD